MGGESAAVVYADSTRAYRVREGTLSLERDAGDEKETSCIQARKDDNLHVFDGRVWWLTPGASGVHEGT